MAITKLQPFNLDSTANYTFANIAATNANLGNQATANFFIGGGNNLSNIQGANVTGAVSIATTSGTVTTAAQPNITSVGTLTSLAVTGNLSSGNANLGNAVNANYFIGNGAFLTGVDTSPGNISNGNSNVNIPTANGNITFSAVGNANVMKITGTGVNVAGYANITGNVNAPFFIGNGSALTGIGGAGYIFNGTSNANIATSGGNLNIGIGGTANVGVFTSTGVNVTGYLSASGNITGGNLLGPHANGNSNVRIATANGNVTITAVGNTTMTITGTGANISGTANITGNVSAPYFIGNGFYLTGVDTSPSNISNGTSNVQIIQNGNVNTSVNGNANVMVVTGLGSNITGYLSVSGSVSGGNISTSGQLTSTQATGTAPLVVLSTTQVANLNAAIAGTVTTNAQPNITSLGSLTGLTVSNATGIVDFTTTSNVTLGAIANLHISGGSANYVLKTDGTGNLDWVAVGGISVISSISNGNSNVDIATSNGNVTLTAVGNTTMTVTGTGANISGYANITGNVSLTGANVNLGAVGNLRISGGASSYVLSTDGASNLSWVAQSGGGGGASSAIQEFSATAGQTTFTVVGGYQVGSAIVFVNGIQMNNADYTATDGTTIVLAEPRVSGDVVRILSSMASPTININSLQNFSVAMSIALGI
jgi:hypothetical protein